jgi:hypothetical protein
MSSSGRRYRIELWVRCSLKSYDSKPFRFSLRGAEVELRSFGSEDQNEGFVAAVGLTRSTLIEAELDAHDLLAQVLDLISLQFKMPALIENGVRSQVEESGEIRHCAIYSKQRKPRSFLCNSRLMRYRGSWGPSYHRTYWTLYTGSVGLISKSCLQERFSLRGWL